MLVIRFQFQSSLFFHIEEKSQEDYPFGHSSSRAPKKDRTEPVLNPGQSKKPVQDNDRFLTRVGPQDTQAPNQKENETDNSVNGYTRDRNGLSNSSTE